MEALTSQQPPVEAKSQKTPQWALDPLERFLAQMEILERLMHISTSGISMLRGRPQALQALYKHRDTIKKARESVLDKDLGEANSTEDNYLDDLKRAEEEASIAQSEIDNDFPLLHSQAIVTVWAFLEGAIRLFVCQWIKHSPSVHETEEIKKIKISFHEYMRLSDSDKSSYLYEAYEKNVTQGIPYGVKRFEKLLEPFALSGELSDSIIKDLHELAQIRNCLVHRAGLADYQLLQKCSDLGLAMGDEIKISSKKFRKYTGSVYQYITLIICRIGSHYGVDMTQEIKTILSTPILEA